MTRAIRDSAALYTSLEGQAGERRPCSLFVFFPHLVSFVCETMCGFTFMSACWVNLQSETKRSKGKHQLLSVPFTEVHISFVSVRAPLDVTAGEPIAGQSYIITGSKIDEVGF